MGCDGVEVAHLLRLTDEDEDVCPHHREAQCFEEDRARRDFRPIEDALVEVSLLLRDELLSCEGGDLVDEEWFVASEQVDTLGLPLLERADDLVVGGHLCCNYAYFRGDELVEKSLMKYLLQR